MALLSLPLATPNVVHGLVFRYRTYRNYLANWVRYAAVPRPFATIDVDPREIDAHVSGIRIEHGLSQVRGSDWDLADERESLKEHSIYRSVEQRFVEGLEWEDTARFRYMEDNMEEYGSFNSYTSAEEFLEVRCRYVDDLYRSIRDHGYRPNFDATHEIPDVDVRANRYRYFHRLEPLVAIGRDGGLLWIDGFHRVSIAKLLDIGSIPVNVLCRHRDWQRRRDAVVSNGAHGGDAEQATHPDLRVA